jgi:hypothetical protein
MSQQLSEFDKMLFKNGAEDDLLNGSILNNIRKVQDGINMLKYYPELGININVRYRGGFTPLIIAASYNSLPIVKLLMSAGADPMLKNNNGESAYDIGGPEIKEFITSISRVDHYTSVEPSAEDCGICIGKLNEPDLLDLKVNVVEPVKLTTCGHMFHKSCITNWFQTHTVRRRGVDLIECPLCRQLSFGILKRKSKRKSGRKLKRKSKHKSKRKSAKIKK